MTDEGYLVYPGSQQAEVQGYIRYCRLLRRIVHGKKVLLINFFPLKNHPIMSPRFSFYAI